MPEQVPGDAEESHRLREQRDRLAAILESSDDAIYSTSLDGTIQTWNSAAERLFEYSAGEVIGQDASLLQITDRVHGIADVLIRLRSDHVEQFETARHRKDGSIVELSVRVSAMRDAATGEVMGVCLIARDISAAKQAERRILASLNETQVLLKEVHHRVKNNLQVIVSLLSMQARRLTDPLSLQAIRQSQSRVEAIALVHEKLYRAKRLGSVDGVDYLREVVAMLSRSLITTDGPRMVVEGDAVPLGPDIAVPCGLIVNELVSNAIKHAFPSGREGLVTVSLRRDAAGKLKLAVTDDGIGLPSDFESRRSRSLGLTLVKSLCEQLSGRLDIKNDDGAGAHFEILFSPSGGEE